MMLAQLLPELVDNCHCQVGVGTPLAAAVKLALAGAVTLWLAGWVVMAGACVAAVTVKRAALLVALPTPLLATAR